MKLSKTEAENSYKYFWLLSKIFPFIKPFLGRIFLGLLIAIPLGLLDGVVAFSLKPYMDYVVGQKDWIFTISGTTYTIKYTTMAMAIPFGVVAFAGFQGVLRYLNDYITEWTSQKITNSIKIALFKTLIKMDSMFLAKILQGLFYQDFLLTLKQLQKVLFRI